jgi:hypothetical protein
MRREWPFALPSPRQKSGLNAAGYCDSQECHARNVIIALSIAIIGLIYRADKKLLFFAWDSLAILAIYVFALCFLYTMR